MGELTEGWHRLEEAVYMECDEQFRYELERAYFAGAFEMMRAQKKAADKAVDPKDADQLREALIDLQDEVIKALDRLAVDLDDPRRN